MSKTRKGQFYVTLPFEHDMDVYEWIERRRKTEWGTVSRAVFIRTVLRRVMEADAK